LITFFEIEINCFLASFFQKNYILPQISLMNSSRYPVLKVLLPYIFGIILGYFLPINNINLLYCIIGLFFFSIISILFRRKRNFLLQKVTTWGLLFSFGIAGFLSVSFHFHKKTEILDMEQLTQKQVWMAEILETPKEREKSYKVVSKLYKLHEPSCWITKKVVLYFQKDSIIENWNVGEKVMVNTQLSFIEPPKNPFQFDYKKFMKMRGIYCTGYVGKQCWIKPEIKQIVSIKRYASYLQRFLSEKLKEAGLTGAEYSVTAGILLGDDDTIEPELKASYAATGVSHILSVSGMHVGIIYMILNFLLKPLGKSRKSHYIKSLILMASVWFYVNITGLSPPAVRSGAMFTFVIVGQLLQRPTNMLQSLFTSLFILLIINPVLLFDVGFELSYLAMFGIVIYQKLMTAWLQPKTKFSKYLWEMVTVSVAAQLTTSPIAIYYFGQFPNYFLLTNLCVVSLSTVMMITGVATLAVSFNSFLSNAIGFVLGIEVKFMNSIILFIEQLPGALTTNISVNFIQVLLLYALIICFNIFQKNSRKQLVFCTAIILNLFFCMHSIDIARKKAHVEVINYEISKCATFQFCCHGKGLIFSDSIHNEFDKRYQFSIKNHDNKKRVNNLFLKLDEDFENSFLCKKGNYIFFQNTIYVLEKNRFNPNIVKLVVYDHEFTDGSAYKLH